MLCNRCVMRVHFESNSAMKPHFASELLNNVLNSMVSQKMTDATDVHEGFYTSRILEQCLHARQCLDMS